MSSKNQTTQNKMTLEFDRQSYAKLLTEIAPQVIETEAEYDRLFAIVERLMFSERTPEETALFRLLVLLIETYETKAHPMDKSKPHERLQHIMESSGTRQTDLVGTIGSSGVVSEIVSGKRAISKRQAKLLGDRFNVSPGLFI